MLNSMTRRLNGNNRNTLSHENDSEIDITPMLDVVFIMLIFFIVTASFVKESGIGINAPSASPTTKTPTARPIVLEISASNEIKIQNRLVSEAAIKATIIRLKAESPESDVVVTLHPKALTQTMIAAIDGLRSANILLPSLSLTPT